MTPPSLLVVDLGVLPFTAALELQRAVARARIAGTVVEDVLLLVEHPPVVTLGRASKTHHLVAAPEALAALGVELHEVERGGDVTFHGPGQLVGYPVIDLKRHKRDLHWYLRQVEEALIRGLAAVGVAGERSPGYTGVWVGGPAHDAAAGGAPPAPPRKIASIGVHARDWVTWHGFALNVTTDLDYFGLIVPCGIAGVTMTSVAAERHPQAVDTRRVREAVADAFAEVFGLVPARIDRDAGMALAGLAPAVPA